MLKNFAFNCAKPVETERTTGRISRVDSSTVRGALIPAGIIDSGNSQIIHRIIPASFPALSTVNLPLRPLLNKFFTQYPQRLLLQSLKKKKGI